MANSTPPPLDELMVAAWRRPETALCVVIDRSGSMGGERLAAAAVAAAACSWRAPQDYSVIAFGENVLVIKAQDTAIPAGTVVNDVFCLRGHGVTNMAAALRAAGVQLQRSRAKRRIALLLSDCRPTTGEDPTVAARALDELCIVAPRDDGDDASALAVAAGAAWTMLAGPSDVPRALASLLDR
jgi:Mg-chelatase subunit ChlD